MSSATQRHPPTPSTSDVRPHPADGWSAVCGFLLGACGSLAAWRSAGPLQGGLFGAVVAGTMLVATLVPASRRISLGMLILSGVVLGVGTGPAASLLAGQINRSLFASFWVVLVPYLFALAALGLLAVSWRFPPPLVSLLVILIALLWLGWPVWLSPWLAGRDSWVGWLSPAHPLLALDAAVVRQGGVPWVEHRLMYGRLTVLGQHVLAQPASGVLNAALLHGSIGLVCLAVAGRWWRVDRTRQRAGHRPGKLREDYRQQDVSAE